MSTTRFETSRRGMRPHLFERLYHTAGVGELRYPVCRLGTTGSDLRGEVVRDLTPQGGTACASLSLRLSRPSTSFIRVLTCICSHSIYKWQADRRRQTARPRSASYAGSTHTEPPHPAFEHIHEPGGFRRAHVLLNDPERAAERPIVRNFIEFLYMFGHFVSVFLLSSMPTWYL